MAISTIRLFRTLLYSRLNQRHKDQVQKAWHRESLRFVWGNSRRLAQHQAVADIQKVGSRYRTKISFEIKLGQFEREADSKGHRRLRIPIIVDAEFAPQRRPDPIEFAEGEPGHWGKLLDGENAGFKVDYQFMVRYVTIAYIRSLWGLLSHEEFRALRLANRDSAPIEKACPLYVDKAHEAMRAALDRLGFKFDATNKMHHCYWNDVLEAAQLVLTARESQTRNPRCLIYSRLNERHREKIHEAWMEKFHEAWSEVPDDEPGDIDLGKLSLSAFVEITFRPEGYPGRYKQFGFGEQVFSYEPATLSMTIPIIIDRPLAGL